jgi:hypothetical protein
VDPALRHELNHIRDLLERIIKALGSKGSTLNLQIRAVYGKVSRTMALAPLVLLDTEKVLLSVAPLLADGTPDTSVTVSWVSSDPSVGIEVQADSRSAFALTPNDSGAATVTASASGYTSESVAISYAPGVPRALNLSAGNPVPDA